jgi:putative acetyltransferase
MAGRPPVGRFVSNFGAIEIRAARPQDAAELAALFHASVRQIAALHYSEDQVRAWSPDVPDPARFVTRITDGRTLLVASVRDGAILAYGDVEANGHIDHFYARPDAAGKGIARVLYDQLEKEARKFEVARLFVEASEPASRFFVKQGFTIVARNDFEIAGVPIHNFRMEKMLLC